MDKLAELSRKATRCELDLEDAEKDLNDLTAAVATIRKQKNKAQDRVNKLQMLLVDIEKEIAQLRELGHAL